MTLTFVNCCAAAVAFVGAEGKPSASAPALATCIYSPPPPPLVGVELNPGPGQKKAPARKKKVQLTNAQARKRLTQRVLGPVGGSALTEAYIASLVDPFQNPAPKLGWGTMVPTSIGTGYVRGTITCNADGSASFIAFPSVTGIVYTQNGGVGSTLLPTATAQNAQDATTVQSTFALGRPVSIGLRTWPVLAATASPGLLYTGSGVIGGDGINAITDTDCISFPTTIQSRGIDGAVTVGYPIDPSSFLFSESTVDAVGWATAVSDEESVVGGVVINFPLSIPYHVYRGLPADTSIAYEVVFNFEATAQLKHSISAPIPESGRGPTQTLSDHWPNVESMWNGVKSVLPAATKAGIAAASVYRTTGSGSLAVAAAAGSLLGPYLGGAQTPGNFNCWGQQIDGRAPRMLMAPR